MLFGKKLLSERRKRKMTTTDLAEKCGISRSYITLMETNKRLPGKKIIPKLAEAFDIKTIVIVNWYLEDLREKLQS